MARDRVSAPALKTALRRCDAAGSLTARGVPSRSRREDGCRRRRACGSGGWLGPCRPGRYPHPLGGGLLQRVGWSPRRRSSCEVVPTPRSPSRPRTSGRRRRRDTGELVPDPYDVPSSRHVAGVDGDPAELTRRPRRRRCRHRGTRWPCPPRTSGRRRGRPRHRRRRPGARRSRGRSRGDVPTLRRGAGLDGPAAPEVRRCRPQGRWGRHPPSPAARLAAVLEQRMMPSVAPRPYMLLAAELDRVDAGVELSGESRSVSLVAGAPRAGLDAGDRHRGKYTAVVRQVRASVLWV